MAGGPTTSNQNQQGLQNINMATTGTTNQQQTGTQTGTQTGLTNQQQTGSQVSGFEGPSWAQPAFAQISGAAGNLYGSQPAINATTQAGLTGGAGYAQSQAPMMGQVTNWISPYARGDYVTGGSPAFQAMQGRNAQTIADLTGQGAAGVGRYGSAAMGNAVGRNVGNYLSDSGERELQREQGLQLQAAGMMPAAYAGGLLPYTTLQGIGQTQAALPWQHLQNYASTIMGLNPAAFGVRYGTTAQDTTGQTLGTTAGQTSGTNIGSTTGTNVGNQLNYGINQGQQNQPTNWAALAASALPMLLMSDERTKEHIEPVGKLKDGQKVYRFNYRGDPTTHIGLLAQEVMRTHPEAVAPMMGMGGILGVDYDLATRSART